MQELLTMLDTKYKRLEYIQSTGTQYIDTGYVPTLNTKIRVKFCPTVVSNVGYFGARKDPYRFCCTTFSSATKFAFSISNNTWSNNKTDLVLGQVYDCIAYNGKQIINGIEYDEPIVENWGDCGTVKLSQVQGDFLNNSSAKYYYCQIWESGVLVRNMIPVMRKSDNEIGMLDLVEGKFYPNAGTGKFTANLDTMYALIQGTPTVQDGRVSDFSASNYLETSNVFDNSIAYNNGCVFQIKVTLPSEAPESSQQLFYAGFSSAIADGFIISTEGILNWYIFGSTNILRNYSKPLTFGNTYVIRGIIKNGNATLYCGADENHLEQYATKILEVGTLQTARSILFGVNRNKANSFGGLIDLNRSYIKIDDTKYKLQAVVGYTVVGNPTITDGVVSGFSSSNYLKINNVSNTNSFEFQLKFRTNSLSSNQYLSSFSSAKNGSFRLSTNGNLIFYLIWNASLSSAIALSSGDNYIEANKDYIARIKRNNDTFTMNISSDNGKTWELVDTLTYSSFSFPNNTLYLGLYSTFYFNGSIDLNNTYIKINNKLWFNGLEA